MNDEMGYDMQGGWSRVVTPVARLEERDDGLPVPQIHQHLPMRTTAEAEAAPEPAEEHTAGNVAEDVGEPPDADVTLSSSHDDSNGITMIPVDSINVLNPRERSKHKFREILNNISDIGIKKPITVRKRSDGTYDLVCGQGRLEAFKMLGQTSVPAIVRDVSVEESLLMSLVENLARKRPTTMDTIRHLAELRDKGYTQAQIGQKTGMGGDYVCELLMLYDKGEERLLTAVESGAIPMGAAIIISKSDSKDVQKALLEAREQRKLNANELKKARVLADLRNNLGINTRANPRKPPKQVTSDSVVRAFRREQERQRAALRKADLCEKRLLFTVNALRVLLRDDNFINLLRAEGIDTMPEYLAEQIKEGRHHG